MNAFGSNLQNKEQTHSIRHAHGIRAQQWHLDAVAATGDDKEMITTQHLSLARAFTHTHTHTHTHTESQSLPP